MSSSEPKARPDLAASSGYGADPDRARRAYPCLSIGDRCFGSILPDIRQNTPKTTIMVRGSARPRTSPTMRASPTATQSQGHQRADQAAAPDPQTTPFSEEPSDAQRATCRGGEHLLLVVHRRSLVTDDR